MSDQYIYPYIYPWTEMYPGLPVPYQQPYQSKYHNLGLNMFNDASPYKVTPYPYKNPGLLGDYGPSQSGCYQRKDTYPLDAEVMLNNGINPYKRRCGLIKY